ncbi:MAG TPA: helix-turn-helix domain-containing protein [Pyrinomonadaceae bacterium]|jgi:excisionase family DNA binding protein|nr:helix-turn-helix domain-containing protein [Pyrinomonadaceae bacterium]
MDELLTTADVAKKLGLTVRAVQKMIEAGRLQAKRVGRDYIISAASLNNIERKSRAGRPPKTKVEAGSEAGKKRKKLNG